LRRRTFENLGGFDPRFAMYLEDVDLCRRLNEAGWNVRRCRTSSAVHLRGASAPVSRARDHAYHDSLMTYLLVAGYPTWQVRAFNPVHRLWQWGGRVVRRAR